MFRVEWASESSSCFMEVESAKVASDLFSLLTTDDREKPFIKLRPKKNSFRKTAFQGMRYAYAYSSSK